MVNLWQQMLATNGNKVKELKLIMLGTSQSGSSKLIETFTEKEFTSKDSYGLGYSYYDILEAGIAYTFVSSNMYIEEPVVRVGVWQCNDIENEELLQLTLETKTVEKVCSLAGLLYRLCFGDGGCDCIGSIKTMED